MRAALDVPILLLIFNRPETTRRVLEALRPVRPAQLYVAADGPREGVSGEAARCASARDLVAEVGWPCEIKTLFREKNLGCGLAVSSGISWFFEHVEAGIILEDDCVPGRSFFRFCRELLDHYRDDERVMHVSGNSYQYGRRRGRASYYFSRFPNVWGWASWRRAWKHYDFGLRPAWVLQDTWDTQWELSLRKMNGLSLVPNANLVQNIGFGSGATHTRGNERPSVLEAAELGFPLVHPAAMEVDERADLFTYYAHHRMVKHLSWMWLYQLVDLARSWVRSIRRRLIGQGGAEGP